MKAQVEAAHRVGWLELFFDLVFVVVIRQLTFRMHGDPGLGDYLMLAFLLLAVWACWINVTLLANARGQIAPKHRPLVLGSMAGVGLMAIGVPTAESSGAVAFAVGYAVARVTVWPLWSGAEAGRPKVQPFLFGPLLAVGWVASIAIPEHIRLYAWGLLIVIELVFVFVGMPRTRADAAHMTERVGLFIMIVLGESIAELLLDSTPDQSSRAWLVLALAFAVICGYWWIYFDTNERRLASAGPQIAGTKFRDVLVGAHYFLVLGLILLASGLGGAIEYADEPHLPATVAVSLGSGAALFYLAMLFTNLSFNACYPARSRTHDR